MEKMKTKLKIAAILISFTALQGCNNLKKNIQPTEITPPVNDKNASQLVYLKQCLNNASELAKLNKKYRSNYDEIHQLITETKSYSSFSDKTSESVTRVVTPLFEYKINYKCNTISHLLIEEYNNRAQKAGSPDGDKS